MDHRYWIFYECINFVINDKDESRYFCPYLIEIPGRKRRQTCHFQSVDND